MLWKASLWGGLFLVGAFLLATCQSEPEPRRKAKLFPIFQIVRFENTQCDGGDRNGTCYTSQECEDRGGENSGSCADGYGVCCTFDIGCGAMSNENCTYFESDSPTEGGCTATICPCNNDICQLRLDFEMFDIAGPSAATDSVAKILNGVPAASATIFAAVSTQCLTDTFVVSNAAGTSSDVLCGVNTGQHLYVETDSGCTELNFQLGTNGGNRNWRIKVQQFGCQSPVRAPKGCDQFYFGMVTDEVQSFNFDNGNGLHLANQNQAICVRRERAYCRICWYTMNNADFELSGSNAVTSQKTTGTMCCGYGNDGLGTVGFDCVMVPGAVNNANTDVGSNVCGRTTVAGGFGAGASICSTQTPFVLNFRSDSYEFSTDNTKEASAPNGGFRLFFTMDAMNCP